MSTQITFDVEGTCSIICYKILSLVCVLLHWFFLNDDFYIGALNIQGQVWLLVRKSKLLKLYIHVSPNRFQFEHYSNHNEISQSMLRWSVLFIDARVSIWIRVK